MYTETDNQASMASPYRRSQLRTLRVAVRDCAFGKVLVAATPRGVCAVLLGDTEDELPPRLVARFPGAVLAPCDDALGVLAEAVLGVVHFERALDDFPLDLLGTPFQQRVWQAICAIPVGTTATYRDVAERIGMPRAVRAVGTACGQNPVAVIVPCHRVLRSDGSLGGYRWGLSRKKALLARERLAGA